MAKGDDEAEDSDDEQEEPQDPADDSLIHAQLGAISHLVAKRPALSGVSLTSLVNDFGAVDFLQHLNEFIQSELSPSGLITASRSLAPLAATTVTTYSLYKRAILTLPAI